MPCPVPTLLLLYEYERKVHLTITVLVELSSIGIIPSAEPDPNLVLINKKKILPLRPRPIDGDGVSTCEAAADDALMIPCSLGPSVLPYSIFVVDELYAVSSSRCCRDKEKENNHHLPMN